MILILIVFFFFCHFKFFFQFIPKMQNQCKCIFVLSCNDMDMFIFFKRFGSNESKQMHIQWPGIEIIQLFRNVNIRLVFLLTCDMIFDEEW